MIQETDDIYNYEFIKRWLHRGEIKKLAEENRIDQDAAYKILNGMIKNFPFVEKCYERAKERAVKHLRMKEEIKALEQKIAGL